MISLFTNTNPIEDITDVPSLNEFLSTTKKFVQSIKEQKTNPHQQIIFVMGNESADFDSIISSIVLAWYLYVLFRFTGNFDGKIPIIFVPYMNTKRENFLLREEIGFSLQQEGINHEMLTFLDDLNLQYILPSHLFYIILTDHNHLAANQTYLKNCIIGIIDHHQNENLYESGMMNKENCIIEKIGSCCSQITNLIYQNHPTLLRSNYHHQTIIRLLTSVILMDTYNMDDVHMKIVTEKDKQAIQYLTETSHSLQFRHLTTLKNNISDLNIEKLLLKDSKMYSTENYSIQISSVPQSLDEWFDMKNPELKTFLDDIKVDALIILTCFYNTLLDQYKRELLLLVPVTRILSNTPKRSGLQIFIITSKYLEEDSLLQLEVVDSEITSDKPVMKRYNQKNISSSRKQVAPCIEKALKKCQLVYDIYFPKY